MDADPLNRPRRTGGYGNSPKTAAGCGPERRIAGVASSLSAADSGVSLDDDTHELVTWMSKLV
jgi:hypothetical protein